MKLKKHHPWQLKFLLFILFSFFFIHLPFFYLLLTSLQISSPQVPKETALLLQFKTENILPLTETINSINETPPKVADATGLVHQTVKESTVSLKATVSPKKGNVTAPESLSKIEKPKSLKEEVLQTTYNTQQAKNYQEWFGKTASTSVNDNRSGLVALNAGEFLPNYKIGTTTYLNVEANPHILYYVKLLHAFRLAFSPKRATQNQSFFTPVIKGVYGISLQANGELLKIIPLEASGYKNFDAEVLRMITASAPYEPVPQELLDKDHNLNMAWTFSLHLIK